MPPAPSQPTISYGPTSVPLAMGLDKGIVYLTAMVREMASGHRLRLRGRRQQECAVVEGDEHRSDADGIAVRQPHGCGDALAASKRAVLAAEVLEDRALHRHHEPRVAARH